MIRLALAFYPNQANPARACGKGVYRVDHCFTSNTLLPIRTYDNRPEGGKLLLYVPAAREFKRGSRVDPLKAALDGISKARIDAYSLSIPIHESEIPGLKEYRDDRARSVLAQADWAKQRLTATA